MKSNLASNFYLSPYQLHYPGKLLSHSSSIINSNKNDNYNGYHLLIIMMSHSVVHLKLYKVGIIRSVFLKIRRLKYETVDNLPKVSHLVRSILFSIAHNANSDNTSQDCSRN